MCSIRCPTRQCIASCKLEIIFAATKYFRPTTLNYLLRALLLVSNYGTQPSSSIQVFSPSVLNEDAAVFCLDRLCDVLEKNAARLSDPHLKLWSTLYDHFFLAISHAPAEPTFYMERLVVNILRFSVRLIHSNTNNNAVTTNEINTGVTLTTSHCIQLLSLLLALSSVTLYQLHSRITAGLQIFLQTHGESIKEKKSWEIIGRLLLTFKGHPQASTAAFSVFTYCIENHSTAETYTVFLGLLYQFGQKSTATSTASSSTSAAGRRSVPVAPSAPPISGLVILDVAMKLHTKLSTPAMEQSINAASNDQLSREKMKVDLWLASVQQFCLACRDRYADLHTRTGIHTPIHIDRHQMVS